MTLTLQQTAPQLLYLLCAQHYRIVHCLNSQTSDITARLSVIRN